MHAWDRKRNFRPAVEGLERRELPALGPQFPIDINQADTDTVAAAVSANGTRIAVWDVDVGGQRDIFAQRYDAGGQPLGLPFAVADTQDSEASPDVAMDAAGNFVVVVWEHNFNNSGDLDVRFQVFTAGGLFAGVAAASSLDETVPQVFMNNQGQFVVAYQVTDANQSDVFARRYDQTGQQLGAAITVSASAQLTEFNPRIDGAGGGRFSIAYKTANAAFNLFTLYVRRYSAAGKLLGKHKIASGANAAAAFGGHDLAVDARGNTLAVFTLDLGQGRGADVFSRLVTNLGQLQGRKTLVASAGDQTRPAVTMTTKAIILAFQDAVTGLVKVREFNRKGVLLGLEADTIGNANPAIDGEASIGVYFVAFILNTQPGNKDPVGAFGILPQ